MKANDVPQKAMQHTEKWLLPALLLLTSICVLVPLSPWMPKAGLDPSWVFGMNQVVAQGLAIGRDIVFTFGPYASIYTKTYHPAVDGLMILGSTYFALAFGLAAALVFRKGKWYLQLALLASLAGAMYWLDPMFLFYPMLVAVWAVRVEFEAGQYWKQGLLAFFVSSFGLLVLSKGSTLPACMVASAIIFARFALERSWRKSAIVLAFPVSVVIFWIVAGQSLSGLPSYFQALSPIISGYTEAMAIDGKPWEVVCFAAVAVFLLGAVFLDSHRELRGRLLLTIIVGAILFLSFKAGFVRHDIHTVIAGGMLLLTGSLVALICASKYARVALLCSLVVGLALNAAHTRPAHTRQKGVMETYRSAWDGMRSRITDRNALARKYGETLAEIGAGGLPSLEGTTNIYSFEQALLFASGNTWNPRPVFQSYSAYTPSLIERNRAHLLGDRAPDNLVFKVQAIDGRLPSLEDGASWPEIIRHYEPTGFANEFLLLKRTNAPRAYWDEVLAKEQKTLGEVVTLPDVEEPIFVKVNVRQNLLGKLINLLYKPSQLRITLNMESGETRSFRFISAMGQTGFLGSPLIEDTQEFSLLYAESGYLEHKRIRSFVIEAVSGQRLWRSKYKVEFIRAYLPALPDALRLHGFDLPEPVGTRATSLKSSHCEGVIDSINGVSLSGVSLVANTTLTGHGWLAVSIEHGLLPDAVKWILHDAAQDEYKYMIPAKRAQRPDVGAHFKKEQLNGAGYSVMADISSLRGEYSLMLAYEDQGNLTVCPQYRI